MIVFTAPTEEDSASLSQKNRQCLMLGSLREVLSRVVQGMLKVAEVGGERAPLAMAFVLFSHSEQVHTV